VALAAFYQQATGLELHPESGDDFAGLTREDGLFIGFQRADGYRAPSWPDQGVPHQHHAMARLMSNCMRLNAAEMNEPATGSADRPATGPCPNCGPPGVSTITRACPAG